MNKGTQSVSAEPLLALAGDMSDSELARTLGINRSSIIRWRKGGGIRTLEADRCAVALGRHPFEIWPDYWEWPVHDRAVWKREYERERRAKARGTASNVN